MLSIYCKSLVFTKENISVDREHNKEPQSRPATLLALTDIQHNWAETMVCHNWK